VILSIFGCGRVIAATVRHSQREVRPAPSDSAPARVSSLVRKASNGNTAAFEDLYRIFQPKISRLATFYLGRGGEDATAETFLRAWVSLPRYRETGAPFAAWLYAIARHVVADQLAATRRFEPTSELPDRNVDTDPEDRLALAMAIARLLESQRRVIELKFLVGLSNEEVAATLGKSAGAVNTLQWRALRALRRLLDES
jgi:RNA polymerase sigma-70 factor, ECF subfamily